jgi:hypothetical protein
MTPTMPVANSSQRFLLSLGIGEALFTVTYGLRRIRISSMWFLERGYGARLMLLRFTAQGPKQEM